MRKEGAVDLSRKKTIPLTATRISVPAHGSRGANSRVEHRRLPASLPVGFAGLFAPTALYNSLSSPHISVGSTNVAI